MTDHLRERLKTRITEAEQSWRHWSMELIEIRRAFNYSDEGVVTTRGRVESLVDLLETEIGVFDGLRSVLDESDEILGAVYALRIKLVALLMDVHMIESSLEQRH